MNDFSEIDEWVTGLENLGKGMATGSELFARNEARYLLIARRTGVQALQALRPEDVDPVDWSERVEDFADLLFSRMRSGSLEILFAGRTDAEDANETRETAVTYEDVLEWVQAGVENGGKDKTAIETNRGRSDEQIAYDVHTAIRQHHLGFGGKDYQAISDRLERWVRSRVLKGDFGDLLVVVLDTWREAVGIALEKDLAAWADEEIRDAFD
jgi:hypothetical protein